MVRRVRGRFDGCAGGDVVGDEAVEWTWLGQRCTAYILEVELAGRENRASSRAFVVLWTMSFDRSTGLTSKGLTKATQPYCAQLLSPPWASDALPE